jgi:hypothetical protein
LNQGSFISLLYEKAHLSLLGVPVMVVAFLTGQKWKVSSRKRTERLWGPPSHRFKAKIGFYSGGGGAEVARTWSGMFTYIQCWKMYGHITNQWYFLMGFTVTNLHFTLSQKFATNRKVAGSIPDGVIWIFHWHNPSYRTIALGSTQPLTEMSTRSISWG